MNTFLISLAVPNQEVSSRIKSKFPKSFEYTSWTLAPAEREHRQGKLGAG